MPPQHGAYASGASSNAPFGSATRRTDPYASEKVSLTWSAELDVPEAPVPQRENVGKVLSGKRNAGLAEIDNARFS